MRSVVRERWSVVRRGGFCASEVGAGCVVRLTIRALRMLGMAVVVWSGCGGAEAQGPKADEVVLQLMWLHGFQFAGYYAAVEMGYYGEVGLDVLLVEGGPGLNPVEEVVSGRADFGVGTSELFVSRHGGKPVVVLAAIYQHSAAALLTLAESGITSPQGLVGRRVMALNDVDSAEYLAMFRNEGVDVSKITWLESSFDVEDLVAGRTDAFNAYVSNEPWYLEEKGYEVNVIRPITYGIDFYGDCLFTSEDEILRSPERVRAFREASLRGWEYAMGHCEELIEIIASRYDGKRSRENLRFEAETMRSLILPELVEIGHMNPGRWRHIADTYVTLGLADADYSLDGFFYDPNPEPDLVLAWRVLGVATVCVAAAGLVALVLLIFNRRLRAAVVARTSELAETNETLHKEIGERRRAEEALRESRGFLQTTIDSLPEALMVLNRDYTIALANRVVWEMLESRGLSGGGAVCHAVSHARERPCDGLAHPCPLREVIARKSTVRVEHVHPDLFGSDRVVEIVAAPIFDESGEVVQVIESQRDITDRKKGEEERRRLAVQFQQAQKLESLGILAEGIAHDFNNRLMTIMGGMDLALEDIPRDSKARLRIGEAQRAASLAAELTGKMLAYAGKAQLAMARADLNDIIKDMARLIESSIPEGVVLKLDLAHARSPVDVDASHMRQVLMSLITNACESLGGGSGGTVAVTTGHMHCTREYLGMSRGNLGDGLVEGDYAYVDVRDTGCGMDVATLDRAFEPFFSTKFTGRGLGLPAVLGIVRSHKGAIIVDSEPGTGSTFRVLFPVVASSQSGDSGE